MVIKVALQFRVRYQIQSKKKVRKFVHEGQRNELERQSGSTMMKSFEILVNAALNDARSTSRDEWQMHEVTAC